MKYLLTIIVLLILVFVVSVALILSQYGTVESFIHSEKSDCDLKLPSNFKIVYNETEKDYAIREVSDYGYRYLWLRSSGFTDKSYSIYTTFSDSCHAKSFVKEYFRNKKEDQDTQNGYK